MPLVKQLGTGEPGASYNSFSLFCPGIGCGNPHQIGKGAFKGLLLEFVALLVFLV